MASEKSRSATKAKDLFQRIPPSSIESERGLLGCILIDNQISVQVREAFDAGDFYFEGHRIIYKAMLDILNRGAPVDMVTLVDELKRVEKLEKAGGAVYIASLPDYVPTTTHIGIYAKTIRNKAAIRNLIATANEISARAYEDPANVEEFLDEAKLLMTEDHRKIVASSSPQWQSFDYFWGPAIETSVKHRNQEKSPFILTHLPVDDLTCGLKPGYLTIIAGRPGMGKTMLALYLAVQISKDIPILFASLELSGEALAFRVIGALAGINSENLYAGQFDHEQLKTINSKVRLLNDANFRIEDSRVSLAQIRSGLSRYPETKVVFVDYLQLIQVPTRIYPREAEVNEISQGLKAIAKEFHIHVIALSQLNRTVEGRRDKRPLLGDLRESGQLEQDANQVWLLYRASKYFSESEDNLEIIIAKNTFGQGGIVKVPYEKIMRYDLD